MPRRKPTRHGATQPEGERAKDQLLLRLTPQMIQRIRRRAKAAGMSVSGYVESVVMLDPIADE